MKVGQIKFSDIALPHYGLRNTPITANRVIASLSTLFNWCERAMLLLPETKAGARPVYLSAPALSVRAAMPRVSNNSFIIVGEKQGQHLINLRKTWLRLGKVARLRDVRIHDLLHSFASVGVSGGATLPIIGKLLGHTKSSTTEKYSHLSADPVRAVNDAMGIQIAAMLSRLNGNVLKFKSLVEG